MPTQTEFFGIGAHNLGPLTTTYEAPSSCATGTDHIYYANKTSPVNAFGRPTCGVKTWGDCLPSGKSWDSIVAQTTEFANGLLAHDGSGSVSASGALTGPSNIEGMGVQMLHPTDYWAEILERSETVAYCCPSNYNADSYGMCISTLGPRSSYNYTAMCFTSGLPPHRRVSVIDGTTLTEPLLSQASATETPSEYLNTRVLSTLGPWSEALVVATGVPVVPLVYKESDMEDNDDNGDDDGGDGENTDDNAAPAQLSTNGVVSVLGLTMGILAGMGMLL
ncbi:hypothetical protein FBEOM_13716 [Fusarium beomiforme]|uniref:Uncharacterized protein n=1 Tax=Fusarium beomiforme TaxID=44412 RepID=A0A9P5A569_9HYPO|nr:hypothetical protein FBEOM_13716 [Fusarium beomiforme]